MFTTRARICRQRQRRASLSATSCAVPVSVAYKIVRSRSSCAPSSGVEDLEDDGGEDISMRYQIMHGSAKI